MQLIFYEKFFHKNFGTDFDTPLPFGRVKIQNFRFRSFALKIYTSGGTILVQRNFIPLL
jgi:hypothetical protein